MPSIPVYNEPQVRQESLPGVRQQISGLNDNAFGPVTSSRYAAGAAEDLYAADQKKKESLAAEEAFRAKSEFTNAYVDKQSELRQRQGKNAAGVKQELDSWMADNSKKYYDELKDPRAKQLFMHSAMQMHTGAKEWANGWETQQGEIAHDIEWKANKEAQISLAENDSRPEVVSAAIAEIRRNNQYQAARKGWDEKVLSVENQNDINALHKTILKNAMEQDSMDGVSGYLHAHGNTIDASTKATAEKWLHKKTISETAGAYADGLLANGVPLSEALKGTRDRFSGDDEDVYVHRVKERYGEAEDMKRIQERETMDAINRQVADAGGDVTKIKDETMQALLVHAPEKYTHIKAAQNEALSRRAAGISDRKYSDPEKLSELENRLQDKKILEPELEFYRPFLNEADYKTAKAGLDKNQKISDEQLKEAYLLGAPDDLRNKKSGKWTAEENNDFFYFKQVARNQVKDLATQDAANALSARMWMKGDMKGSGWSLFGVEFGQDEMTKMEASRKGKLAAWEGKDVPVTPITAPGLEAEARLRAFEQRQAIFQQAQNWAKANPEDPRSAEILKRVDR